MRVNQTDVPGVHTERANIKNIPKKIQSSQTSQAPLAQASVNVQPDFSVKSKELATAKQVALAAPELREEKVKLLSKKIHEGDYTYPVDQVADRLVDEHLAFSSIE